MVVAIVALIFSILFIVYSRNTGNSFWIYWAPFILAGGALLLGIPVYKAQQRIDDRARAGAGLPMTTRDRRWTVGREADARPENPPAASSAQQSRVQIG